MALIQSNKCLLQILVGNDYLTVMCLRSFTVNTTTTEKETTTPVDGKYKDFDYKQLSFRASLDGILYRETTGNTVFDFAHAQNNFIEINFRAVYEDEAGQFKVFVGQAIVMDVNLDASAGSVGSGSIQLLGKGAYVIEDNLPEFVNLRLIIQNSPTAQAFFKFWLINANGEAIFQTDVLPQASGGNLANPLDITVPIPKGSWYYWFQVSSNEIGNQFDLNAPPTKSSGFNNGVYNEGSFPAQLYDFTADRQVSISLGVNVQPPACVAPGISQGLNNPSGAEGTPWQGQVVLTGSQPFTISNVVKPAWMNISLLANVVTLEGTQPVAGINQPINFDANNACGSISYADTIDISANPNAVLLNFNYTEAATMPALSCAFRLFVNAVLVQAYTSTNASNYICNPGDTVEIQIIGNTTAFKHIDVQDSVAGEIYNSTTTGFPLTKTYSFVTTLGHNYTINAAATNS